MRKQYKVSIELVKLVLISVLIGLLCSILGYTLKKSTEHTESVLAAWAALYPVLYFLLPLAGFSLIYLLRQSLFKKKENKGIKEIYNSLQHKKAKLPFYKIPSHYINGFLTVITGGSTGIEVSAVVATATIGSISHQKARIHLAFRKELICAATASGVTILFGNPLAGLLFAYEVIAKKMGRFYLICALLATGTTWIFEQLVRDEPLFQIKINDWHLYALPYFILAGILAGLHSVYLTRCVLFFKNRVGAPGAYWTRVLIGVVLLGCSLLLFPQLYGEGYHGMKELFVLSPEQLSLQYPILMLAGIFLLKPIVTAATLSAGGDGGVFAPSLFAGAFLGLALALFVNRYFHAGVVPVNFMVIGMAAVLSGCLHAPYTAAFLALGLTDNYVLLVPVLLVSVIAWLTARYVFPYTVYSYGKPAGLPAH